MSKVSTTAVPPGPPAASPGASVQIAAALRMVIFVCIFTLGFAVRLFSIIRYESIIHEFDPWFNFRSTKVLVEQGPYAFWNWFDERSWFPLGRIVGGTVYPGIMFTAALIHKVLNSALLRVDIREVCVLTAPTFSALTALASFLLTKECDNGNTPAALLAAALVVLVPGYMSRSVAGSYDNEAVAITAMISTFYAFVKTVNTGSIRYATMATLVYMYMVSTWGGYVFIINLIPIYVVLMLLSNRYSPRLYVAYSIFYVLGTLLSMQIRFVGFNAVRTGEHMAAAGTFALLNIYALTFWVKSFTSPSQFRSLVRIIMVTAFCVASVSISCGLAMDYFGGWEGRFRSLLDPTFAKRQIPLIASVSEHQPTSWDSILFALHAAAVFTPVGLFYIFANLSDANLFLVVYCFTAVYFVGVMVRLLLVLAPIAIIVSSIGFTHTITPFIASIKRDLLLASSLPVPPAKQDSPPATVSAASHVSAGKKKKGFRKVGAPTVSLLPSAPHEWIPTPNLSVGYSLPFAIGMVVLLALPLFSYVQHGLWASSEAYSSPSVVLSSRDRAGNRFYIDDYREAYYWLNQNTREDDKVLSWWDYGYQIAGFSNRTTVVDNNTWNNTHIGMVGRVLNSPEDRAHSICTKLGVEYVLIIFGGKLGFSGDDVNKFLWPVRISRSVDPSVKEEEYLTAQGGFSVGDDAGPAFKKSLLYKMSYYRFLQQNGRGNQGGYDLTRNAYMAQKEVELDYFDEAFTSEHWLVRIYRVKQKSNRGFEIPSA